MTKRKIYFKLGIHLSTNAQIIVQFVIGHFGERKFILSFTGGIDHFITDIDKSAAGQIGVYILCVKTQAP